MNRRTRIALVVAVVAVLCTGGVCGTVVAVGPHLAEVAGCPTGTAPTVSGVLDDTKRVRELLPALGDIERVRYRWRESRPHTCPEIAPVGYIYQGFAVLSAAAAGALRTAYHLEPAPAPQIPRELAADAPPTPDWHRSPDLDTATRADIWLDPATGTAWFDHLHR